MPEKAFDHALRFFYDEPYSRTLGVAVSGGGDSMALLDLAYRHASDNRINLKVATVNHNLRQGVQAEIDIVAQYCAKAGLTHDVFNWADPDPAGNLMQNARNARYALLEDWAQANGMDVVLLGHTADDQAETVLMNLSRGSGVDGLSGMGRHTRDIFVRPLLDVSRADLRTYLSRHAIPYVDDPTNDDDRFARVRARKMLDQLADLGLTRQRLVQTADHMANARAGLQWATMHYAKIATIEDFGDLIVPRSLCYGDTVDHELGEIGGRVLSAAVQWIGGGDHRPRYQSLKSVSNAAARNIKGTLQGVVFTYERRGAEAHVRLSREPEAARRVPDARFVDGGRGRVALWDRRWEVRESIKRTGFAARLVRGGRVHAPTVRALGDAIDQLPKSNRSSLPRSSLMASPAVFNEGALIAAPVAGFQNGWTARIVADFGSFLVSR